MLTGSFTCGTLSRDPFLVLRGKFQLFNNDSRTPNTQNLSYDFDMINTSGEIFRFNGRKLVDPSISFSPVRTWRATSTLYVTITRARDNAIMGRGILHIAPLDFAAEMGTLTPSGNSLFEKVTAVYQFLGYFTQKTMNLFLAPFSALSWPRVTSAEQRHRIPPAETLPIVASDGIETTIRVWYPDLKSQPQLDLDVPVLFLPGAAVDHGIFTLPTIKLNAIEYFTGLGATCFCVTHRVGKTEVAKAGWTIYDARLDIVAALDHIAKRYPPDTKVYVVAHCAGSMALSMGLLDGTIPADRIRGITASNVFMNPKFATVNMIKANTPISLTTIYEKLGGEWFSCSSNENDSLVQQFLNQILRFYPVGSRREICNSVVCHRSELVFGR